MVKLGQTWSNLVKCVKKKLVLFGTGRYIQFHPKCEEVNLTHLCFADDIFLFAGGTSSSVQVIMDELNRFENFSGLQVNKQKSAIFLAGVNDDVKNDLLSITGFCLGSFTYEIPWSPTDLNKTLSL